MQATMKTTILTAALALIAGSAAAQQTITVNIGSSHPEQNIWVYAMKNTFQPEVNRILAENGGEYTINWVENYAGTLYKFTDTREAVMDGIVGCLHVAATELFYPAQNPSQSERIAVVAVGGYGRGTLAPGSDVDLLFLFPHKQTAWGESVVEAMAALRDLRFRGRQVWVVRPVHILCREDLLPHVDDLMFGGDGTSRTTC